METAKALSAAHRASTGELSLVLFNTTGNAADVNIPLEIDGWSLVPELCYQRTDWIDGRRANTSAVEMTQGLAITLPAYTPAVTEFKRAGRR